MSASDSGGGYFAPVTNPARDGAPAQPPAAPTPAAEAYPPPPSQDRQEAPPAAYPPPAAYAPPPAAYPPPAAFAPPAALPATGQAASLSDLVASAAPVAPLQPLPPIPGAPMPGVAAPPMAPAPAAAPSASLSSALQDVLSAAGPAGGSGPAPVGVAPSAFAPVPSSGSAAVEDLLAEVDFDDEPSYVRTAIEEDSSSEGYFLNELLVLVLDSGASDLHLTAGARPTIRLHGHLQPLEDFPVLTPQNLQKMVYAILTQKQRERFEEELELDFAYAVPGKARFRTNVYRQRDAVGAAFRLIPFEIKRLEDLGVPPAVANFAMLPRGFVLVTGPTGSGKSTTLASLIDLANRQRKDHIMTVEDPIEFLHHHQACLVNQREVGEDTHTFQNALKHVLRQDPDIILVGEMRDLETIQVALTAAETGHLVFATLHTQDAAQTIDRIIDVFPPHQQQQVRVQLAGALQGVVAQQLARTVDGKSRVVACEVLNCTPAIRNLIREGKTHQIYSSMQAGAKFGMHTMDQHLADLVKQGRITFDTGLEKCHHVEDFNRLCGRS